MWFKGDLLKTDFQFGDLLMDKTWEEEHFELMERVHGRIRLSESSLNRIMHHFEEDGGVVISVEKSDIDNEGILSDYIGWCNRHNLNVDDDFNRRTFLKETNNNNEDRFYSYLKSDANPYLFFPVFGGYKSNGGVVDHREKSFLVFNSKAKDKSGDVSWEDLESKALEWCKEFRQDSVYIQRPHEAPVYVDSNGDVISKRSSKDFRYNDDADYYTTVKRKGGKNSGKRVSKFTADISFKDEAPSIEELAEEEGFRTASNTTNMAERIKKDQTGELWFED